MTHNAKPGPRLQWGLLACIALLCAAALLSCQSYVPRDELAQEYYNLGNAYFGLERYDQATDYYRRALELSPELDRANYNLARALVATERYADAIALLQELRRADRDNVRLTETLAYAELQAGNRERAVSLYETVLELSPYRVTALYNLGVMARRSGDLERAAELLGRAQEAAPDDLDVLFHLGLSLLVLGEEDRGVAALERFTEESAEPAIDRLSAIAEAYEEARFYSRALMLYETILERDESRPSALFGLARIRLTAAEQPEEGLTALEEAISAGFSDRDAAAALLQREDLRERDAVRTLLEEAELLPAEEGSGDENAEGDPRPGDAEGAPETNKDEEGTNGGAQGTNQDAPGTGASDGELRAPADAD